VSAHITSLIGQALLSQNVKKLKVAKHMTAI